MTADAWNELDNKVLRMKKGQRDRPQRRGTIHFQLRGASAWLITLQYNTKLMVKGKRGKGMMIIIWSRVCTVPLGRSSVHNIGTAKKLKLSWFAPGQKQHKAIYVHAALGVPAVQACNYKAYFCASQWRWKSKAGQTRRENGMNTQRREKHAQVQRLCEVYSFP